MSHSVHDVSMDGDVAIRRVVVRGPNDVVFALKAEERTGKKLQQFRISGRGDKIRVERMVGRGYIDEKLMTMVREFLA